MAIKAPELRGPAAAAWSVVSSRWTAWLLALALGVAAALGLTSEPGQHPAEGLLMQLPAALLPFALLAQGLAASKRRLILLAAWSAGAALAFVGGTLAGGEAGWAEVGGARPTEGYTVHVAGRTSTAALGGQLTAALTAEGAALSLGVKDQRKGDTVLPLTGDGEARIGPWAVHLVDLAPGDEPAFARLRFTPRTGGDPVEMAVRTGSGGALPDGTQVMVMRLSADFGKALGAAAQVQMDAEAGTTVGWHFVESTDLDQRLGTAPWVTQLLSVETEPKLTIGVRRAGPTTPALAGFGLMALALLGMAMERRA